MGPSIFHAHVVSALAYGVKMLPPIYKTAVPSGLGVSQDLQKNNRSLG